MKIEVDAAEFADLMVDARKWRDAVKVKYPLGGQSPIDWLTRNALSGFATWTGSDGKGGAGFRFPGGHEVWVTGARWSRYEEDA